MEISINSTKLSFKSSQNVRFELFASKLFQKQIIDATTHFNCLYRTVDNIDVAGKIPAFSGHSFEETILPYEWKIYKNDDELYIYIDFFEDTQISKILTTINNCNKTILVEILPHSSLSIVIDPFFHPLGSLLMIYLSHFSSGFLVHASGIMDNDNGYLFTGVSGIGKSTMSQLWCEQGAYVVNDDRLWVQKIENEWKFFSTPMGNYVQEASMANLSKIFLLSQSPENHLSQIHNPQGALRLMSNCIQHLFDKEMTASHLDTIFELTSQTPIYELGFKPTAEVVRLVREMG